MIIIDFMYDILNMCNIQDFFPKGLISLKSAKILSLGIEFNQPSTTSKGGSFWKPSYSINILTDLGTTSISIDECCIPQNIISQKKSLSDHDPIKEWVKGIISIGSMIEVFSYRKDIIKLQNDPFIMFYGVNDMLVIRKNQYRKSRIIWCLFICMIVFYPIWIGYFINIMHYVFP